MLPGIWMSVNSSLDVGAGFQDRQRVVGIDGFNGGKARVLDDIDRAHAQHHFVFDDQNGGKSGSDGWSHGCRALSSGAKWISPCQLLTYGFEHFRQPERLKLSATRGHQTGFAEGRTTLALAQAGCIEVGPDLLRAIWGDRADIEPVCLGQGDRLACFHLGGKTGQSHDRRAQEGEYRQGCKGFDHFGLLTVAFADPAALGDQFTTVAGARSSRQIVLIFEKARRGRREQTLCVAFGVKVSTLQLAGANICWIRIMTNSAGLTGAKPITMLTMPFSMSACVVVVLSHCTK